MDGETGFFPQATQQARRVEIEERQRQQEEQRKKMAAAMQEPSRSFKGPYQYLSVVFFNGFSVRFHSRIDTE